MGQGMQWTHYLAMSVSHLCKISLAIRAICLPLFLGSLANNLVSIFEGGYPGGLDGKKKSACNAGDPGFIPGSERSAAEGNGYPLQYTCLENFMDRGAWQATVHVVTKSWTQLRLTLSFFTFPSYV